jgi:hypothetical protein
VEGQQAHNCGGMLFVLRACWQPYRAPHHAFANTPGCVRAQVALHLCQAGGGAQGIHPRCRAGRTAAHCACSRCCVGDHVCLGCSGQWLQSLSLVLSQCKVSHLVCWGVSAIGTRRAAGAHSSGSATLLHCASAGLPWAQPPWVGQHVTAHTPACAVWVSASCMYVAGGFMGLVTWGTT